MASLLPVAEFENGYDPANRLRLLALLERKVLWLSLWMIHHANHIRPNRDGLKVGGHQASCASVVTLMTALYLDILKPEDRVAVKPHASPVFHAIQYLLGHLPADKLLGLRSMGGLQSYPCRTRDEDDVDFSTGSVGLGAAQTIFASLVQDYVRLKDMLPAAVQPGRMIALVGDAELDEGNVYEALLEGWKKDIANVWWIIDYNRQSLDSTMSDRLFGCFDVLFESVGWRVVTLKYGKRLEAAFREPGGNALQRWIDDCPNALYGALTYSGGLAWRKRLLEDIGSQPGLRDFLARYDDGELQSLMTNLAGHDMASVLEAMHAIEDDQPTCFIAYTVKGFGLPFAGHKDNHAGIMNPDQMMQFKLSMGIEDGAEWDRFAGLDEAPDILSDFLGRAPFAARYPRSHDAPLIAVPAALTYAAQRRMSTQEGFGKILHEIAALEGDFADSVVTMSPDVTVSTSLGPWVNRRRIFDRTDRHDTFANENIASAQRWVMSSDGQHVEFGIAEHNLFLALGGFGLAAPLFGKRLLPIGTLYDPFIRRGLDAFHYACYQDARFMLVATPSGITLAPEGGAHQSLETPLITLAQPGIAAFEPAYVDELAEIMRWGFEYMQAADGGSVALRLSTRLIDQPDRAASDDFCKAIISGAYWLREPLPGAEIVIAYSGAIAPEALAAHEAILEDIPGAGLLAITSAQRLHDDWMASRRARISGTGDVTAYVEKLLAPLGSGVSLITVLDGHPATLSWLGSVAGQRIYPLGVDRFGQSGDLPDLYREYGIDDDSILDAVARACIRRLSTGNSYCHD
ncbi:MAG: transketolase [Proteobacteria bacterium]|nr:transketolase [Pseudomonadota bacterium]